MVSRTRVGRRTFMGESLRLSCATGYTLHSSFGVAAEPDSRRLSLYGLHTLEQIDVQFWANGRYRPAELEKINHLLRDHRTGESCSIDSQLLNLLFRIKVAFKCEVPFHVISGYRSAATNAMLRRTTTRVARKSFHMTGRAIDFRIPGIATTDLRDHAIALQAGGVGYYQRSDFVHLDTGPVRRW